MFGNPGSGNRFGEGQLPQAFQGFEVVCRAGEAGVWFLLASRCDAGRQHIEQRFKCGEQCGVTDEVCFLDEVARGAGVLFAAHFCGPMERIEHALFADMAEGAVAVAGDAVPKDHVIALDLTDSLLYVLVEIEANYTG